MTHDMPYRELGRTGEMVSIIGVGGFHLGLPHRPVDAVEIVREAIDAGITFLDDSWDYHHGESERYKTTQHHDSTARHPDWLVSALNARAKQRYNHLMLSFRLRQEPHRVCGAW